MILNPIFTMFCSVIGTETSGNAQVPCQNAVTAISVASKTTETMNEIESYSQSYVYKNMNPEFLKTLIAIGFIQNSIQQKRVIAQFPIKPFEFNFNVANESQQYGVKFRYEF